jgi:hypothetical protein
MNHIQTKYERLGLGSIFRYQLNEECAAAIVTSLMMEREFLISGKEPTAPEWADPNTTADACFQISQQIMRGDYVVAWPGALNAAVRQISADGIEIHRCKRDLIAACIARHLPDSRWSRLIEQREFVVVKTL